MNHYRDMEPSGSVGPGSISGRNVIAVIGVDRYRHWRELTKAVNDAKGTRELFLQLGFLEVVPPLLDDCATGAALRSLVTDDLRTLGPDDSLVVFYAGHGGSQTHHQGTAQLKTGYLIPVDADPAKVATWVDLEGWLRSISLLPPRHILVILDACYSGIALDPVHRWRDGASAPGSALETLRTRRSRRVITSALDDERAADDGPVAGHSLFTGCLMEALSGGLPGTTGLVTGSELAVWVQQRVRTYPHVQQTPDFGAFSFDDRGEIVIPVLDRANIPVQPPSALPGAGGSDCSPTGPPRPVRLDRRPGAVGVRVAAAAVARLVRRNGEWLSIVAPLVAIGVAAVFARSC